MFTSTSSAIATRRRRITSTVTGSIDLAIRAPAGARAVSRTAVNVDLSKLADGEPIPRTDQGARSVFDDERRAFPAEVPAESIAIIDLRWQEAIILQEVDRPHLHFRHGPGTAALGQPGNLRSVHF